PQTGGGASTAIYIQGGGPYRVTLYGPGTGNTCNGTTVGSQIWQRDGVYDLAFLPTWNGTALCSRYVGANAGAKIAACIAALPSTGGVADATGIQGTQTIAQNVFSGVTKPVDLILCGATYTVSVTQSISAASKIRIHDCGDKTATLTFTGSATGITFTNSSDIEIDHLKFTGGRTQTSCDTSNRIQIHDNDMSGAATLSGGHLASIELESCSDVVIERNYIHGNGIVGTPTQGAYDIVSGETTLNVTTNIRVLNNTIGGSGSTTPISVSLYNCNYCEVSGNDIDQNNQMHTTGACTNCSGYAINVYAFSSPGSFTNAVVTRNRITNTAGTGIYLQGTYRSVAANNVLYDVAKQQSDGTLPVGGISINGDNSNISDGNVVSANEIDTSGRDCIVAVGPRSSTFTANSCRNITQAAVRFRNPSTKSVVAANVGTLIQRGFYMDAVSTGTTIKVTGNTFTNVSSECIYLNAANTSPSISENTCDTVGNRGIVATLPSGGAVTGNTLLGITGTAIDWRGDDVSVTGGEVKTATGFGVDITGSNCKITGMRVSGTTRAVNVTGNGCRVLDNNFIGNTSNGNLFSSYTTNFGRGNSFTTGPIQGRATMVAGTVVVNTAVILFNDNRDQIFLTHRSFVGAAGELVARTVVAGTSFTIDSSSAADDADVDWEIVH